MLALLIVPLALMQGPAAGGQRPAPPREPPLVLPLESPRTRADTALAAVSFIADRVARLRTGIDYYQRSLNDEPPGRLADAARLLRQACGDAADAARRAPRVLCLDCLRPELREPVRSYREGLPRLATAARRCTTTLARLADGSPAAVTPRLRSEFPPIQRELVAALRDYEARLGAILRVLPRPNDSPAPARPRRTPT